MLTAGERLKQKRLERKLTFTQISEITKIPVESLRALEKSRFAELPASPFLKGMVRNYALVLNLDPIKIVAMLKRDYDQSRSKTALGVPRPIGPGPARRFLEQPLTLFLAGGVLFSIVVGWSLWRVYQPPRLVIDSPQDGQTAVSPVEIAGRTDRDSSLTLNDETVNLNPDGRFDLKYPADPGEVKLIFRATSRRQKTSEKTILIKVIK